MGSPARASPSPQPIARAIPGANRQVAAAFERIAELLPAEQVPRVAAYRRAAARLRRSQRDIAVIQQRGGVAALIALPDIGRALAAEIDELLSTGRLRLLERLEERHCPRAMLASLPGVGPILAGRILEALPVTTLEELEVAAYDGRLAKVRGVGRRRLRSVRSALAERLRRRPRAPQAIDDVPSIASLLILDARYRELAQAGKLHKIAPHRFNPRGVPWLPVMKAERDGWRFTLMYSNTLRAHRLGTTHDWVVIFFEHDGHAGQHTIITAHRGPLAYRRLVRGREEECLAHYRSHPDRPIRLPMPVF